MDILNERIKQRRIQLGLTLVGLAEKIGVTDATVQRYESGEIKNIKKSTVVKLADALQTTPAFLMGWEETQEKILADEDSSIINFNNIKEKNVIYLVGDKIEKIYLSEGDMQLASDMLQRMAKESRQVVSKRIYVNRGEAAAFGGATKKVELTEEQDQKALEALYRAKKDSNN